MTRTLKRGHVVTVMQPLAVTALPQIEGRAELITPVPGLPNLWRVRFMGERQFQLRFVHSGAFQTDTDTLIDALTDHYRASLDPTILADFFPFDPEGAAR